MASFENFMESNKPHIEWANELDSIRKSYEIEPPFVDLIVDQLRQGDFESAKTLYTSQSDKYHSYPRLESFLVKIGIKTSSYPINLNSGYDRKKN